MSGRPETTGTPREPDLSGEPRNAVRSDGFGRFVPALGASLPLVVIFLAVSTIPLGAAPELGLTPGQLSGWIFATYGIPAVLSVVLAARYRQPLLVTGNVAVIIFVASLGGRMAFSEIVGGVILAGIAVAAVGATGLVRGVARWFPLPIVLGLVAGIVLPFVSGIFDQLAEEPVLVGVTIGAYLLSMRFLGGRIPPVLSAAVAGVVTAAIAGRLVGTSAGMAFAWPVVTPPEFTLEGIVTVVPVVAALMIFQANIPAIVYLRGEGYEPPERALFGASGLGAAVGSLLGPTGVSVPVLAMPFTAGPRAGPKGRRHWTVYILGFAAMLIAILGAAAAAVVEIVPLPLLLAIAGLAMVGVLTRSVRQIVEGPLLLGPLVTMAVAISELELLGLGSLFWALALGTATTVLTEREGLASSRAADPPEDGSSADADRAS